jgi:hypothetical protein
VLRRPHISAVVMTKTPDKARVEEIRREIECLLEEYRGSTNSGKVARDAARDANEVRRQRLLELKLELSQMMR